MIARSRLSWTLLENPKGTFYIKYPSSSFFMDLFAFDKVLSYMIEWGGWTAKPFYLIGNLPGMQSVRRIWSQKRWSLTLSWGELLRSNAVFKACQMLCSRESSIQSFLGSWGIPRNARIAKIKMRIAKLNLNFHRAFAGRVYKSRKKGCLTEQVGQWVSSFAQGFAFYFEVHVIQDSPCRFLIWGELWDDPQVCGSKDLKDSGTYTLRLCDAILHLWDSQWKSGQRPLPCMPLAYMFQHCPFPTPERDATQPRNSYSLTAFFINTKAVFKGFLKCPCKGNCFYKLFLEY